MTGVGAGGGAITTLGSEGAFTRVPAVFILYVPVDVHSVFAESSKVHDGDSQLMAMSSFFLLSSFVSLFHSLQARCHELRAASAASSG